MKFKLKRTQGAKIGRVGGVFSMGSADASPIHLAILHPSYLAWLNKRNLRHRLRQAYDFAPHPIASPCRDIIPRSVSISLDLFNLLLWRLSRYHPNDPGPGSSLYNSWCWAAPPVISTPICIPASRTPVTPVATLPNVSRDLLMLESLVNNVNSLASFATKVVPWQSFPRHPRRFRPR